MSSPHRSLNQEMVQEQKRHKRESSVENFQSRWSSKKTRFIVDRPPSQPLSRRECAIGRLQESGSRWSSGSQVVFDTASPKVLARHRKIVPPSSVPARKHSAAMKNHSMKLETTMIRTGGIGTTLQCAARTA
jgi:hypothetical protein